MSLLVISPTQDDIFRALATFFTAVLPATVKAVQGQVNRVPELRGDFIVVWPLSLPRLATNVDTYLQVLFTGIIADDVLTVSAIDPSTVVAPNDLAVGTFVYGPGVAAGTKITQRLTGTGRNGTYKVSPVQTVASRTMAAGTETLVQTADVVMQIDAHGPGAMNNANLIATIFRDDRAGILLEGTGLSPLYADDPKQMPFITEGQQYENRYTLDIHMQADLSLTLSQEFASEAEVTLVEAANT